MNLNLKDKVAVVTGGTAGIGKGIALGYAKEGCRVAICGRRQEVLEATAREMAAHGCEVYARQVDMVDLSAVDTFVGDVCAHFGHIDIWVNNAAANRIKPALECVPEDFDFLINANVKSLFFATQYVARHMKL